MKPKVLAAVLFAALLSVVVPRPVEAAWSVSISYFHQELTPYGRWVYTRAYGEVWYPTVVAAGWAPYVDGEWIYTDCGWTWASYDPFSDPFHYGTWVWIEPYGWCWVPGYVWGPAWVTWAWTDSYIGWAPLPATFAITAGGYSGGPVTVSQNRYVFVPIDRFAGTNVSTIRVAPAQNSTILARAQRTTRFSVSGGLVRTSGPPAALVERATGRPLRAVKVSSVRKVRPTTISAAGVASGRRVSIVAPARERAAAVRESKRVRPAHPPRIAHREAKPAREMPPRVAAGRHVEREKAPARAARIERHASPARAGLGRHERAVAAPPPRAMRREKGADGPPPPSSVEKRRDAPPPPVVREEHRAAMNRPSDQPRSARREAPPPQAAQPHPGPPPAAAGRPPEQPQPQGQPRGPRKEKGQR